MEVYDHERASRPSAAITNNLGIAVRAIIAEDRRIAFPTIPHDLRENHVIEILQSTLHTIIREHLNLSKLSTCWVPKNLTEDHRTK